MPTFIFSPAVRVYIDTERDGLLDVSEDLTGGMMVRRQDGPSTFDFGLMNTRRKYDGVFTPNDRIIVMMKRLTWLRVFSGYLNTVPLKTIWPREVALSSTCSLKRLLYYFWDPANSQSQAMVDAAMAEGVLDTSALADQGTGGVMNALLAVLDKVTGWPPSKVHIGKIPEDWWPIALSIAQDVEHWYGTDIAAAEAYLRSINPGALWGGVDANASGLGGPESGSTGVVLGVNGFAGTLVSSSFDSKSVSADQKRNAEIIMSTGWDILAQHSEAKGYEAHALACALATSMQEASLLNLPSQAYPESSQLPHDTYANGSIPTGDHDSVGLFQQRAGWGTIAERMNPTTSTTKFLGGGTSAGTPGLLDKNGWQQMSIGSLAQAVQVSAFPTAYTQWEQMAFAMVAEMIDQKKKNPPAVAPGGSTSPTVTAPPGQVTGQTLAQTAVDLVQTYNRIPYTQQYGGLRIDVLTTVPPPGLDCSSAQQWFYLKAAGSLGGFRTARRSADQAAWCHTITTTEALNTPGALLFVSSNGTASGVHHVEMSLGDGKKTVGAHHSGTYASVADASNNSWSFGGLIPGVVYSGNTGGVDPGTTAPTIAGGTGHYPLTTTQTVTTGYHVAGSHWAAGYHTGVDFGAAETGDQITNIAPGTVVTNSYDADGYGNYVMVQVGDFQVLYGHMSVVDPGATVGAKLDTGAPIGEVGDTGNSYGAHLHLEVRKAPYGYGDDIDPMHFLVQGETSTSGSTTFTPDASGVGGEVLSFFGLDNIFDWPQVQDTPGFDAEDPIDQLFGTYSWSPGFTTGLTADLANSLVGSHAMLNDQTVLPYIKNLFMSTMRSFCSAPNGDLIGWFPDYYGLYGTAAKLRLEPIEIMDFNVFWSDDFFVTHQFAQSGTTNTLNIGDGSATTEFGEETLRVVSTYGIANIDSPAVLSSLLGIEPKDAAGFAKWVYDKFGARPNFYQAQGLIGFKAELFSAIHMFMLQWAYQYRAEIPLTFMPEAWPGMLIQAPAFDFQAYVTTVTHSFQFGEGGKFETTLNIAAPAYMPRGKTDKSHALFGLPLAGGYSGNDAVEDLPGAYQNPATPTYEEPDVPKQEVNDPV